MKMKKCPKLINLQLDLSSGLERITQTVRFLSTHKNKIIIMNQKYAKTYKF